jgi:formylglycine-generating enzyme required for sulfatase activity
MYLYIELWKAKDAWLKLTSTQRKAKLEQLLLLAQQHPITGVIPFSFRPDGNKYVFDGVTERPVIISDAVARPTRFHYAAAWMVPTRDLIKQFEDRVESLGWWFEYFDQQNAWGVMDVKATVGDMVSGGQSAPTGSFEGSRPGEERNQFCWCPPGTFQMGFEGTSVTLSHGFWMGKYLVTQEKYQSVMGENPSGFVGPSLPVESVGRLQILAFCQRLTEIERAAGRLPEDWKYRLPTEAQWEYASRAGTTTAYAWSDDAKQADDYSWNIGNSGFMTHPVGQKKPNQWGLYDTLGNTLEWCRDAWHDKYPGGIDPEVTEENIPVRPGESESSFYVCRGGGWFLPPSFTPRVRIRLGPGDQSYLLGFRVAIVKSGMWPESSAVAKPTTEQLLQEWGRIVVGQWTINFVSPTGKLDNGNVMVRWLPGNNALEGVFTMGNLSGRWTAVWDRASEQIKQNTTNSDGSTVLALISKQGPNQWQWAQGCSFPNGQTETNIDKVTVTDSGNTLNHLITNRMMNGRALPDLRMVLQRADRVSSGVSAPPTAGQLQEWGKIAVGQWTVGFSPSSKGPGNGSVSVKWLPGNNALEGVFNMGNLSGKWTAVWDSAAKQIRQNTINSDGSTVVAMISQQGPNQWQWAQGCSFPNGQTETNIDRVTVTDGGNTLNHLVTNRIMDGRVLPDIQMTLKRIGSTG